LSHSESAVKELLVRNVLDDISTKATTVCT